MASECISSEKYLTLSYTLFTYLSLLHQLQEFEDTESLSDVITLGIKAAQKKLLKFFDKATAESELYYTATSEVFLHIIGLF